MRLKLPRELMDTVEDIYKNSSLSPRDYPGLMVQWSGCGDSGGVEDIYFLTPAGLKEAKTHDPENGRPFSSYHTDEKNELYFARHRLPGRDFSQHVNGAVGDRRDYSLDAWVYKKFNLCEINDGSYATVFIEMPRGNVWGQSYHWETHEVPGEGWCYEG